MYYNEQKRTNELFQIWSQSTSKIRQLSARHWNAIRLACHWRADSGPILRPIGIKLMHVIYSIQFIISKMRHIPFWGTIFVAFHQGLHWFSLNEINGTETV